MLFRSIVLEDGDEITIPRLDPTVLVRGAVAFEARVMYRQGASVADYLRQAGGTTQVADERRISVEYPNGERATANKTLFFKNYPRVLPGSTIVVPATPPKPPVNWDEFLNRTLSITASLVTVLLAVTKL